MNAKRRKRAFTPELCGPLEERVVMSGFKFPPAMGPVQTLGLSGNKVLTNRTYEQVQHQIDRTIKAFRNEFARAFQRAQGFGDKLDRALGTEVGGLAGSGPGVYRGMLAKLDRIMAKVEARLPYGLGLRGNTGGVGLSTRTIATSLSNVTGFSVAEHLDNALNSGSGLTTWKEAAVEIERVRQMTLNIVGRAPLAVEVGAVPGILPSYVIDHGPAGSGEFGLRNR